MRLFVLLFVVLLVGCAPIDPVVELESMGYVVGKSYRERTVFGNDLFFVTVDQKEGMSERDTAIEVLRVLHNSVDANLYNVVIMQENGTRSVRYDEYRERVGQILVGQIAKERLKPKIIAEPDRIIVR